MKSWKKRLNEEFDGVAPELSDEVKNAPIVTAEHSNESVVRSGNALIKRRIGLGSSIAAIALALLLTLLWIFGAFNAPVSPENDDFVFALEINPAVAFVTDEDGVVQSVNALNEDADVILANEDMLRALCGAPLGEALATYTDEAAKLGYLDLSAARTAVRLSSGTGTDERLRASAYDGLQSYFQRKGVYAAIVRDVLSVDELCARFNLPQKHSLTALAEELKTCSALFGERIDGNASAETLLDSYQTFVVGAQTLEAVKDELCRSVDDIVENAGLLSKIALCGSEIIFHKDNPFHPLPADYWTVKSVQGEGYSQAFSALLEKMDGLLSYYESKFGRTLESLEDLNSAAKLYASLADMNFEELFAALTITDFQSAAATYVGILKNIGCDVQAVEKALSAPATVQEYLEQLQATLDWIAAERKEKFRVEYERQRAEISDEAYADFLEEMTAEYGGSLGNFWINK